jgi:hypothetical protein
VTRIVRLSIVLALAIVACGGEPTITSRQLASIMPSAANAPAGTNIRTDLTGPKTLQEFVTAQDLRTKLRALGFKVAYVSTFSTPTFPSDPSTAPSGAVLYGAAAIVLRDGKAADQAFSFYEDRLKKRAKGFTPLVTKVLGARSFAFRFSGLEDTPLPGVAYLFRIGNGLFSVVGIGNPQADPDATRSIAQFVVKRAEAA